MVKKTLFTFSVLVSFAFASWLAFAQDGRSPEETPVQSAPAQLPAGIVRHQGTVITPAISDSRNGAHTNFKIFVPAGQKGIYAAIPDNTFAEYPDSLGCVYKVGPVYTGCVPGANTDHPSGGWGAIALVDAYDDATAASDLAFFDTFFDLPKAKFTKVYANSSYGTLNGLTASCAGTPPPANTNGGWDVEESLDMEWAHVMAPSAEIILVEACSQNLPDLLFAEQVAGIEVEAAGGGDISNSWGYPESCVGNDNCGSGENGGTLTELQDDNFFYRYHYNQITYFASAGDSGAEVLYPSASPWVVSVGGTTINRDASGNFLSESCWSDSGGGPSTAEFWQNPPPGDTGLGPWADYQYELFGGYPFAFPARSTPDIALDADPNSGVWVYDTDEGGTWLVVGGTSLSSPALAGIVNASNNRLGQTATGGGWYIPHENNLLYSQLSAHTAYGVNFYDVTTGSNGYAAGTGYDQCTGIGTPRGKLGK